MNSQENVKFVRLFYNNAEYLGLIPNADQASGNKHEEFLKDIKITGLYVMQYFHEGCQANCSFCTQSRESKSIFRESALIDTRMLKYPMHKFAELVASGALEKKGILRICIQTVYHQKTVENLLELVKMLRPRTKIAITACCIPISRQEMIDLKEAGLDHITINYEAATPQVLSRVRGKERNGPFRWEKVEESIKAALEIFGEMNVGTHLLIGLGENQKDLVTLLEKLHASKIRPSLFAFCPVPNTALESASKVSYRDYHAVQLGSYLLKNRLTSTSKMKFDSTGQITDYGISKERLEEIIETGVPFKNAGCPGCNRFYYDSAMGERNYSYPRDPYPNEITLIKKEIMTETLGHHLEYCI